MVRGKILLVCTGDGLVTDYCCGQGNCLGVIAGGGSLGGKGEFTYDIRDYQMVGRDSVGFVCVRSCICVHYFNGVVRFILREGNAFAHKVKLITRIHESGKFTYFQSTGKGFVC